MWYMWTVLLVVSCAAVGAESAAGAGAGPQATTRAPPRTLDRQAAELAWRSWLQSPESGNQNAPPRRITTKSLFITPLVCPKGQRLDSNGCVQVVTVNKDEHERILLEQLNALFTSAPSGDVIYDYGEEESNAPLQLSIPIGLDPQAAPLQAQEPSAQAQEQHPSYVAIDKKDVEDKDSAGLVAELELLQLQHQQNTPNETTSVETDVLNHNVLLPFDKPKRDSPSSNSSEIDNNDTDEGQKEQVYGHVNIDPILYNTETQTEETTTETDTEQPTTTPTETTTMTADTTISTDDNKSVVEISEQSNKTTAEVVNSTHVLRKEGDQSKLNPETDYADIGEAVKLISRYADVRTDENFNKEDQKKSDTKDDSILGTRTKLQYRRRPKPVESTQEPLSPQVALEENKGLPQQMPIYEAYRKKEILYRYPWQGQNSQTPPPNYPFRHLQDYWPGRNQNGGLYAVNHENPRRHHHAYPHNYYRPHSLPYAGYPGLLAPPAPRPRRADPYRARPMRSHTNNQDLYTLLGLRHWISSESTSKR